MDLLRMEENIHEDGNMTKDLGFNRLHYAFSTSAIMFVALSGKEEHWRWKGKESFVES